MKKEKLYPARIDEDNLKSDWIERIFDDGRCTRSGNIIVGYINGFPTVCQYTGNHLFWTVVKEYITNIDRDSALLEIRKRMKDIESEIGNIYSTFETNVSGTLTQILYYKFDAMTPVKNDRSTMIMMDNNTIKDTFDYQGMSDEQLELTKENLERLNENSFTLCPSEYARYNKFRENHIHRDVNKGAIGGHINLMFTMTGIGIGKTCKCSVCNQKADITEYANW